MRKSAMVLVVAALTVTGLVLQPVQAAQAKTHRVQTVKADIDGDGRGDSVRVDRVRNLSKYRTTYKVTVKTAKGRKVSRTLTVQGSTDVGRVGKPLAATVDIDGVKGAEIVLATSVFQGTPDAETVYSIWTWRKAKLVKEGPAKGAWQAAVSGSEGSSYDRSYVFDQVDGVRYALRCSGSTVERSDSQGKTYWVSEYGMDSSMWSKGKWQPATIGAITSTPDPRCDPHTAATLALGLYQG